MFAYLFNSTCLTLSCTGTYPCNESLSSSSSLSRLSSSTPLSSDSFSLARIFKGGYHWKFLRIRLEFKFAFSLISCYIRSYSSYSKFFCSCSSFESVCFFQAHNSAALATAALHVIVLCFGWVLVYQISLFLSSFVVLGVVK